MSEPPTDVWLLGFRNQVAEPAKELSALVGVDEPTARRLISAAPIRIRRGLPRPKAERLRDALEGIGAQVDLRAAEADEAPSTVMPSLRSSAPQVAARTPGKHAGEGARIPDIDLSIKPVKTAPSTEQRVVSGILRVAAFSTVVWVAYILIAASQTTLPETPEALAREVVEAVRADDWTRYRKVTVLPEDLPTRVHHLFSGRSALRGGLPGFDAREEQARHRDEFQAVVDSTYFMETPFDEIETHIAQPSRDAWTIILRPRHDRSLVISALSWNGTPHVYRLTLGR